MNIKHISYRVEFEGRWAAHIHGTLWLDFKRIEKLQAFTQKDKDTEVKHLTEAFRKLRDDLKLNDNKKEAFVTLTDMLITCSLNPAIVTQEVVDIAKKVNSHHCTRKRERKCKYGFPRFPLKETLVIDKHEFDDTLEQEQIWNEESVNSSTNFRKILHDVQELLKYQEQLNMIMEKFPHKGETKEENAQYCAERIDEMLKIAGNINYED